MKKNIIFFIYSFLLFAENSLSQEQSFYNRLNLSVEPRYGFVAPHHDYMAYFLEKNISSLQLNVGLSTFGNKNWQKSFNYPQIGIGYYTSGLGNDKIYGKMNALYLFVDRKFFPIHYRLNIGNRMAFGLSHISKQYDKYSNPYNMAIATPVNVFIQYDLISYFRVTPTLNIRLNLGFTHASNGSVKEPNKGFNIITTGIGFQYCFSDERGLMNASSVDEDDFNEHQFNIGIISGYKSISRFDNSVYPIAGLSAEYLYRLSSTTLLGAELTGYWDSSIKDEFRNEADSTYRKVDNICMAVNPIYMLRMGRVFFSFQPGIYLKNSFKPYGVVSNKVGLRYLIVPNLYLSMSIKAHWLAKADFIEFGVRYNLLMRSRTR